MRSFGIRAALLLALATIVAWGQAVSTSQIKGTVVDPTGLAVAGATVKVTQTETGTTRTAISGGDGGYILPDLPVGPYRLEVTKEGFARQVQTGIVLQVASNPTIEVVMKIGQVNDQVVVEANATMVETQSTGIGGVIDNRRILDLPLVGRQVTDLITLAGAATAGGDGNLASSRTIATEVSFSVAGGLASGATYVLDGAMHNDPYTNLGYPLPFPDALQEFKVETSALPAQYGMHSAAAINAVTVSGTNAWHGDAFEFVRNYEFNARNFFATKRDTLKRNQYGGTFGGPILKNKLFFFAAYQGTPTRQDAVQNTSERIPTPTMLTGDFSAATSAACNGGKPVVIKDPLNGNQAFVNNFISPTRFSAPAVAISGKLPNSLITNSCGQVIYGAASISNEKDAVAKVDYQLTPSHSMFARYVATSLINPVPYSLSGGDVLTTAASVAGSGSGVDDLVQTFALGDTYLISPNIVNSFRATLNRSAIARVGASFFGPQDVGINIYSYLPKYTTISVTGGFSIGGATDTDAQYRTTTLQFGDDLSWVKGKHQISLGANLAHWNSNTYARVLAMGQMSFSGQITGFGLADFLTGNMSGLAEAPPNTLLVREWYTGLYAQDSWKVKPRLTISYGVRWEPYFPMTFAHGLIYQFDQGRFNAGIKSAQFAHAPAGLAYPGDPGFPGTSGMNTQWKDFAPRVGVVWDPKGDGKMSIRASFGMFYDLIPAQYHLNTETAPPFFVRNNLVAPPGGLANPYLGQPGGNPFPVTLTANSPFPTFGTFNTFDYNNKTTYVEQWNFSVERQIAKDWLVKASYLGNQMVHLFTETELNPAVYGPGATLANTNNRRKLVLQDPVNGVAYGFVDKWDDGGTGNYNGLLLSVQKRYSRGVTLGGNYTWSHCIADVTNSLPNGGAGGGGIYIFGNNRSLDRGNCSLSAVDHRHIANLTAVAEMPKLTDNKWMNRIIHGWRAGGAATLQSGGFLTIATGADNALSGEGGQRPNLVAGVSSRAASFGCAIAPCVTWLNNSLTAPTFTIPAQGTYGNLSTANIEGPGSLVFNASMSRLFRIREHQTLELRADAQNLLNKVNFGSPGTSLASSSFGLIQSGSNARIMQFAVKYMF